MSGISHRTSDANCRITSVAYHAGFPPKCQDKKSGLFSTRDTKKSGPISVLFRASNNKFDNNNCNISAQDTDEHTQNTNCSTCNCNARFYELGLTRDSRVIPGLTVVSVLSTSNLGLNWDKVNESYTFVDAGLNSD